jgi:hypothetical protein
MCGEHAKLLKVYQASVAKLSVTLDALAAARGTALKPEYQRMAGYVEQAHGKSDEARAELDRHATEHGCYR